jgi:hypothetical protein
LNTGEDGGKLAHSLIEAFNIIFDMYEEAIEKIPTTQWASGEIDYLIPARLILHAIETGDFYSSKSPEGFPWGGRFGEDTWDITAENLPSREMELEYHHKVRKKVESWLCKMSEYDLLTREEKFPWTGSNRLGRVLYLLAHYRQHFGEVNAELRRRGLPRIVWRTLD